MWTTESHKQGSIFLAILTQNWLKINKSIWKKVRNKQLTPYFGAWVWKIALICSEEKYVVWERNSPSLEIFTPEYQPLTAAGGGIHTDRRTYTTTATDSFRLEETIRQWSSKDTALVLTRSPDEADPVCTAVPAGSCRRPLASRQAAAARHCCLA